LLNSLNPPNFDNEWQALNWLKNNEPKKGWSLSYSRLMEPLVKIGKLDRKYLQHAEWIGGAYTFYLKTKPFIDSLKIAENEQDAIDIISNLKESQSVLFSGRGYSSMLDVLAVGGKLDKGLLQTAQWLGVAYDFYLREDVKPLIDNVPEIKNDWQAFKEVKKLKRNHSFLFSTWEYGSLIWVLSIAGKINQKIHQSAHRLVGAYDFYLKEEIKPIIDELGPLGNEWKALEVAQEIKEGIHSRLFINWSYSSMAMVFVVSSKLDHEKLQSAHRLFGAYDFYLKEEIKPVIEGVKADIKDEWQALDELKNIKRDYAPLFSDWGYSSMMGVLAVSERLGSNLFPLAHRLGSIYDFYLRDDIKPLIDNIKAVENEWQALDAVKYLKQKYLSLFNKLGYSNMMLVLAVAGKIGCGSVLQTSRRWGGSLEYILRQESVIKNLLEITFKGLDEQKQEMIRQELTL